MADYFAPKILDIKADAQGNWTKDVPDTFFTGIHSIIVADQKGNENVSFFSLESKPTNVIERVTNIVPGAYLWYYLFLGTLVAVLIVNNFQIALRADKLESEKKAVPVPDKKKGWRYKIFHRYRREVLWTVIGLAVLSVAFLIYLVSIQPLSESPIAPVIKASAETPVQVSGTVLDPMTKKPLSGVELTVGNTTIRTGDGGSYLFSDVYPSQGIKISHPQLLLTLTKLPDDQTAVQTMDIYFDPTMYKKLVQYIDLEARGRYGEIYNDLPDEVKNNIEPDKFIKSYETIFGRKDIAQQTIMMRRMKILDRWGIKDLDVYWNNVISVEVFNQDQNDLYYLVYANNDWWVLK